MIQVLLFFWTLSALLIVWEQKIARVIIYLSIFSLITSVCFLLFAAPDVAMAEAAISIFATIFFIVCFEKYYALKTDASRDPPVITKKAASVAKRAFPLGLTAFLFVLFICFIPDNAANTYLKDQYVSMFSYDVGGKSAVTAILLGYRMFDTMFEALMLLVSMVAVVHLSWYSDITATDEKRSDINRSAIAAFTIRLICPVILIFGAYLAPIGGFQGGVVIAAFFICRYMIYNIYEIRIEKMITTAQLTYAAIILLSVFFIYLGAYAYLPQYRNAYLKTMYTLIGIKVACGFTIIFYRFIVFERR